MIPQRSSQLARDHLANSRLRELEDGRFAYEVKKSATPLVFTGTELLARITPLIPPPRSHLTRYHGMFAPGSKLRALVVPKPPDDEEAEGPPRCHRESHKHEQRRVASPTGTVLDVLPRRAQRPAYRVPWAELLRRTFGVDVLACPKCDARRRVIAYIEEPSVVRKILRHLGLPDTPLPTTRSRGPPQEAFAW